MSLEPIVKSGDQAIYIRVVIDTDSLPVSTASREGTLTPTTIPFERGYMIVASAASVKNQGSDNVAFVASANDTVHFFATSGSNNFEQSVVIQDICHSQGDQILQDFKTVRIEQKQSSTLKIKGIIFVWV